MEERKLGNEETRKRGREEKGEKMREEERKRDERGGKEERLKTK